jgi:hypothetical protein
VTITFRSRSDGKETKLQGKWSAAPEPLTLRADGQYEFDITKSAHIVRLDVCPGQALLSA